VEKSLRLDESHSLYLLGEKSSSPFFKRYRLLMEICAAQGEFLSFEQNPEWLSCYQQDAQDLHTKLPLLVFRPHTIANIAPFLEACHQMDFPVSTRCGGTGLAGGCVPSTEGVVVLTGHLKNMREYDRQKGTICLEPGVTVRELNRFVKNDLWIFPLSMSTEGVAGIAGCLSSHARGYHQQQEGIFDAIQSVTLADGQGQILEVPSPLVCGAEGLWGVILEIKVQLQRPASFFQEFLYWGSWETVLAQLPFLRSLHSLSFLVWWQERFYLGLEGEAWRLAPSVSFLNRQLPGIEAHPLSSKQSTQLFLPNRKPFVIMSTALNSSQLPEACQWSLAEANELQLECLQQADVLAGSLHLILQSQESLQTFIKGY
jgi:glycolate oxidase